MQVGDEAAFDWISADEDDGYGRRRKLGCQGRGFATHCDDDSDPPPYEVSGESREPVVLTVGPTIIGLEMMPLGEAQLTQTAPDRCDEWRVGDGRAAAEQANHRQRMRLRARRERPRSRAANQPDDPAPVPVAHGV